MGLLSHRKLLSLEFSVNNFTCIETDNSDISPALEAGAGVTSIHR